MLRTKTVLLLALATVLMAGTGMILAQGHEEHGEGHGATTIRGEILDMACFMSHGAKGADHAGCAKRCAEGGQPIGLLTDDGTVYLLYASHADASAFESARSHAGQKVEITGVAAAEAGMKGMEVHGVKPL